ncbi:MAG TPA: hypothetical protein VF746_10080 [Longimicrobium sp.]|jgi:hypothetical protein
MTLAQFALAAQADPKWVQNAVQTLGLYLTYSEEEARRLGLARVLGATLGMPLRQAWEVAAEALEHPHERALVVAESPDGSVQAVVDVLRYLSSFTVALSRAQTYVPRAPGRPVVRERSAVEAGREYGIDISLIESNLQRTPAERLRLASDNAELVRALREGRGK